ncbi:hypothetical protein J4205_02950, partial [Candidatus Pacearchaeota archaeon]|nr:hypothetical protein [Candidatus Pacearchaeota archaeon]
RNFSADELLVVCCVCEAIKPGKYWIPKSNLQYGLHNLFYEGLSHSYCPPCMKIELEKIESVLEERRRERQAAEVRERVEERRGAE